jgi:hypothetical protein
MCNFCCEACQALGHKIMTISDVCDRIRELGFTKKCIIERHMASINEESICDMVRIESINCANY